MERLSMVIALLCMTSGVKSDFSDLIENCRNLPSVDTYQFNTWILVPFDSKYKFSKPRVESALKKAIADHDQRITSANSTELSKLWEKINVTLRYRDSECDADASPNVVSDIQDEVMMMTNHEDCHATSSNWTDIEVIIGMTCDYAAGRVATLANHWNWTLIYPGTRTHLFDDKAESDCCSSMVRPGITRSNFGEFVVDLYKRFQWNTSVVFYTLKNSHSAYVSFDTPSDCGTLLGGVTNSFTLENWVRYKYYNITTRNNDESADVDLELILNDIKDHVRVSLWCVGRRTMRRAMEVAKKLGMTSGDYAFIYVDLYNTNTSYYWTDDDDHVWADTSNSSDPLNITAPHIDDSLQALTVITLYTPSSVDYRRFSDSIKDDIETSSHGDVVEYGDYVNPFISYYYDALMTLYYGIVKSLCQEPVDFTDGSQFAKQMWNIEFESIGRNVTIGENGDRFMDYSVLDMNNVTNKFEVVLHYKHDGQGGTWEELGEVDWPGSAKPMNIPECGFRNEKCDKNAPTPSKDNTLFYALFSCLAFLLLTCMVLAFLFRKMLREKRLQKMLWRVKWESIEWSHHRKHSLVVGLAKDSNHSIASSSGSHNRFTSKQLFTKIAIYKDEVVSVKEIKRKRVDLNRALLIELEEIYALDHQHICKFIGAVIETPHVSILTEYCMRGSLQDLLEDNTEYEMEEIFKKSLISDIINGMQYLHRTYFKCHGNLKSSNCLIDSRFLVKLTDFGLSKLRAGSRTDSVTGFKYYENKLWTAPELLRGLQSHGSSKGDVYSFAIVVQEIIYRKGVFYTKDNHSPQEILHQLTGPVSQSTPLRPTLEDDDFTVVDPGLRALVQECWAEDPQRRPDFNEIQKKFKKMKYEKNLVDSLLKRLEHYSRHLEEKVEERTEQYRSEKERADMLLYQMLPRAVADQLKKGNNVLPKAFESVTIFFSDIVGFTAISHSSTPMQVVNMLNDLYTMFDQVIDKYDVYKVETIGDAYMVVSGLPEKNENRHAREIARMSLSLLDSVNNKFKITHMPSTQLKLRVGIHTGPVVAGVVGLKMPRYCLFGDTVNTASRMESNGKALAIHVSPKTKEILDSFKTFHLEQREEEVFLKGLGNWQTWWLNGEDPTDEQTTVENEEVEPVAPYNRSKRGSLNFVTFEMESPVNRRLILPSLPHRKGAGDKSGSPASIMKTLRRLSVLNEAPPKANDEVERRHRAGTIKNFRIPEQDGDPSCNFRKAKINQLNTELSSSATDSDPEDRAQVSFSSIQKGTLHNYQHGGVEPPNQSKKEREGGRDSGIGLGFDSNLSHGDNPSSEDDTL